MKIVLFVLLLICGVDAFCTERASQPPDPSKSGKVEQANTRTTNKNENPDQLKVCTETLAAINKLLNAQEQEKATIKNTHSHKEGSTLEWWHIPDIWVAIFTGILAAITGALAYFTLMLWRATKAMVDEASRTSKRQADDTKDALEISFKAANAAMEQARTSTEELKRSNRAWVGVTGAVKIVAPLLLQNGSASCKIQLTLRNVGTSPALNTIDHFKLIISQAPSIDPLKVVDDEFKEMMSQNKGITIIPGDPMDWPTVELKESISVQCQVYVWLNGYFGYKDEFDTLHYSSFLFSFITPCGERKIPQGNHVQGRFEPFASGWVNT